MEICKIILMSTSFIGGCAYLSTRFNISWRIAPFLYSNALIIFLFIAALIDFLPQSILLLDAFGLILGGISFRYIKRSYFSLSGLVGNTIWLAPFITFFISVPRNYRFLMSDEFPSWGANIRTLFIENSLPNEFSPTRHIASGFYQSYPPAQQLFQYYFLKHSHWLEANVLLAQGTLVLFGLMATVAIALNNNKKLSGLFFWCSISIYYLFGFTLGNILADGLLAVYFGCSITLILNRPSKDKLNIVLSSVLSVLTLIKPTGFLLTICALIVLLSTSKVANKRDSRRRSTISKLLTKFFEHSIPFLTPFIMFLGTYFLWQSHLSRINMQPGTAFPTIDLLKSDEFKNRWVNTVPTYWHTFSGSLYGDESISGVTRSAPKVVQIFHISLLSIIVILFIVQALIAMTSKSLEKTSDLRTSVIMLVTSVAYQIFLIFMYLFFFGQYEGERVSGLVRYSGAFLLGWTLLVFLLLIKKVQCAKQETICSSLLLLLVIISTPNYLIRDIGHFYEDPDKLAARLEVEKGSGLVSKVAVENQDVYFIKQNSTGEENYLFGYLSLPRKTNWSCWSIGEKYYEGDVWTCPNTLDTLTNGYKYILIIGRDENFSKSLGKLQFSFSRSNRIELYERIGGNAFRQISTSA